MTSIENGREKDEARQIVADFGSKGLVRLTRDGLFRHEAGKNTRDRKHAVHWQDGNGTSEYAVRPTHRAAFAVDFNGWRADNRRVRCISVGLSCLFPVEGMEKRQREKGRTLPCV